MAAQAPNEERVRLSASIEQANEAQPPSPLELPQLSDPDSRPGQPGEAAHAKRFQTGWIDPRLLGAAVSPPDGVIDRGGRAEDPLRLAIESFNDSTRLAEREKGRATVWSMGIDGTRWSVGPDEVRAGGIGLPLRYCSAGTCSGSIFEVPPGRRIEYSNRLRSHAEIRRQASRAELDGVTEQRIRAIRDRKRTVHDSI